MTILNVAIINDDSPSRYPAYLYVDVPYIIINVYSLGN